MLSLSALHPLIQSPIKVAAVSHILPMFQVGEELESGSVGKREISREAVDAGAGPTSPAANAAAEDAAALQTTPDGSKGDLPTDRLPNSQTKATMEAPDPEKPSGVERSSWSKDGEGLEGTPDSVGGRTGSIVRAKTKDNRVELTKTRTGSKTMCKTGRRSMTAVGRRSGGKVSRTSGGKSSRASGGAGDVAPANTPHLQVRNNRQRSDTRQPGRS